MGGLEVTVEEQLMDIFSMKDIKKRIDKTGLSRGQFKQKLIDGLENGDIRQGKTADKTLTNYDNYLKWERFWEGVEDKLSRGTWGAIGIALTAPFNYLISSPIINRINKEGLFSKEGFLQFTAFSLSAFVIEKRILTGLGNYLERTPINEKPNMNRKDYVRLLSGYIISEFPRIRKRGKEIINSYMKEGEPEKSIIESPKIPLDLYSLLTKEKEAAIPSIR